MQTPSLTVDEVEDILYLARTNEATELASYLEQMSTSAGTILAAAVDADTGNTVLHYAGANGHVDILALVQKVMAAQASSSLKSLLNAPNTSRNTPLHWAALNGQLPFVRVLISLGADASLTNAAGHDAIFEAEINGKTEVAEWLLKEAVGLEAAVGLDSDAGEEVEDDAVDKTDSRSERGIGANDKGNIASDEELRTKVNRIDCGG